MDRIGRRLISDMKAAVHTASEQDSIGRKDFSQRNLLSLLVQANMASDVSDNYRLSDDEVLAQIPTFLFAGHETTSSSVGWILYALACNPVVQDTLRAELVACDGGEHPEMEALNNLPYLDVVVREALRLYSPVQATIRTAEKSDVIPTDKEWTDNKGIRRTGIPIAKGDRIIIPILAMNRSKDIWGEDAYEFKPERWSNLPAAVSSVPGVWGNSLAFLGGARACIGYRFSVVETKAIIYTLVRTLRYALAVGREEILVRTRGGITRPVLRDSPEKGTRLPLRVSLVEEPFNS